MSNLRDIYAQKALYQIPRLLSSQDRNRFSPTYGCMNREFWLCRSTDFPSSIAQFGTHALALAYANEMPGNIYYQHPKMLDWTLAGVDYWTKTQHADGSFDEFYPNERGWAGPTGFLVYAMCDSYRLIQDHFPQELKERFLKAVHRAGLFLAGTDEIGVLANHHAMAVLPIYEAYVLTGDEKLKRSFDEKLDEFFTYTREEGWCLEYDGADPGYLSATISFLGKLTKLYQDERFDPFFERAIEFSSYFVYPNGHYAGTMGSRQTLHFYPHGYEMLTKKFPLAQTVADKMLQGLKNGALVPPEIQGERYFVYRIPEFLLSYADFGERAEQTPAIPYERENFTRYFAGAKIYAQKTDVSYSLINAAKGGVVKHFQLPQGDLKLNNCGVIGRLNDGRIFTSQWIDDQRKITQNQDGLEIEGRCHWAPSKVFTPVKFIIFRLLMLMFGWHERTAYWMKGGIRKLLMTGQKPAPVAFKRTVKLLENECQVTTRIDLRGRYEVEALQIGDEFPARYVPQSRYFQPQELDVRGYILTAGDLETLNSIRSLIVTEKRIHGARDGEWSIRKP